MSCKLRWPLVLSTIVFLVLMSSQPSLSQQSKSLQPVSANELPLLTISFGPAVATDVPVGQITLPATCDEQGRVYMRMSGTGGSPFTAPVYRIAPDGTSTVFAYDRMPDIQGKEVGAFTYAVDRTGGIHAVVQTVELKRGGVEAEYIASFSSDGTYRSRISIDKKYRPISLVALSNGNYYVSGLFANASMPAGPPRSFSVLLDSKGTLIRDMHESVDEQTISSIENRTITAGSAWEGTDGLLYVLRATVPPTIQSFKADGTPVKTVGLPSLGAERPSLVAVGSDQVWIDVNREPRIYAIANGQPISRINVRNIQAPGVGCSSSRELVVLKSGADGKFALLRGKVGR